MATKHESASKTPCPQSTPACNTTAHQTVSLWRRATHSTRCAGGGVSAVMRSRRGVSSMLSRLYQTAPASSPTICRATRSVLRIKSKLQLPVDRLTPQARSWNMSRIRSENTSIELAVRSMLHRDGFRFRLHDRSLPGRPDVVLPKYRVVIFVHGCFWHRHAGCELAKLPKTRRSFWNAKLEGNATRDRRNRSELRRLGWTVISVWECQLSRANRLRSRLTRNIGAAKLRALASSPG